MAGPDVRYAQNSGISIAYQVFGNGPRDLVLVCGTMSNLELFWSDRGATAMLEPGPARTGSHPRRLRAGRTVTGWMRLGQVQAGR